MGRVPPPFLSMDDRIQYLEMEGYFSLKSILIEDHVSGYVISSFRSKFDL